VDPWSGLGNFVWSLELWINQGHDLNSEPDSTLCYVTLNIYYFLTSLICYGEVRRLTNHVLRNNYPMATPIFFCGNGYILSKYIIVELLRDCYLRF